MNTEINKTEVGKRIRSIRQSLGLSMDAFAERIDNKAKSGTVSNWETGKNLPNNERLKRIATLGNKSLTYLLYGQDDDDLESLASLFINTSNDIEEISTLYKFFIQQESELKNAPNIKRVELNSFLLESFKKGNDSQKQFFNKALKEDILLLNKVENQILESIKKRSNHIKQIIKELDF